MLLVGNIVLMRMGLVLCLNFMNIKMETENIQLPKQLVNSIRELVKKTKLYQDENEFIMDAIITQIRKHNGG